MRLLPAVIVIPFGILGAVMAYVNAYDGWGHYPAISRRKRIGLALRAAGLAVLISIAGLAIALLLLRE